MEIVREILLDGEKIDPASGEYHALELEGRDGHVVYEHAVLLEEEGYIVASFAMGNPPQVVIQRLTWVGHDLLDSIHDDSIWSAVKRRLAAVGGAASVEVVKAVAVDTMRTQLGISG